MSMLPGFALVALLVLVIAEVAYRLYEAPMNAWIRASWIGNWEAVSAKA
jgi:peptidoglycan/LPS O-acetylase OafA/YrhL